MKNKQILIGFAGRKQSGKNTCSEHITSICARNNISSKIYSLADPLKQDICMNLLGLSYDQCYGNDEQKNTLTSIKWENMPGYDISWTQAGDYDQSGFMTARQVMQFIGTDLFRKIHTNVWIDGMINKIKSDNVSVAICCDIRFVNEVERFKMEGGTVIKLTRNPYNSNHSSETALDPDNYDQSNFDLIIDNQILSIEEQCFSIDRFLKQTELLPL